MIFVKPIMYEFEPIKIANVIENGDVNIEVIRFIALYERQCLDLIFGKCLAKELVESFEFDLFLIDYKLKASATTAIKNLVNGLEYVLTNSQDYNFGFGFYGCGCGCNDSTCNKRKWNGLVEKVEYNNGARLATFEKSFLADYIYYEYQLANRTVTAGTGQQVLSGENSMTVQNCSKRIEAYNSFVLGVIKMYVFLEDNKVDYPTWERNCNICFKEKW